MYKIGDRFNFRSHSPDLKAEYIYTITSITAYPLNAFVQFGWEVKLIDLNGGYYTYNLEQLEQDFELIEDKRIKRVRNLPEWF